MISLSMWVLVNVASTTYGVSYSPPMATMADCEVFKTQVTELVKETRTRSIYLKCVPIKVASKQ